VVFLFGGRFERMTMAPCYISQEKIAQTILSMIFSITEPQYILHPLLYDGLTKSMMSHQ
jgi:hypothetical protein